MDTTVVAQLLDLNRSFYEAFGHSFSATRQRIQLGVRRVLGGIPAYARVLDLGCGNGSVAWALIKQGFKGNYIGVDSSKALLGEAHQSSPHVRFICIDLAAPDWESKLTFKEYDYILAFAVMHHLPGVALRRSVVLHIRELLAPGGRFIHSHWQFLTSSRLRARIQPWEIIGLKADQVEIGDTLLDWRRDGYGLRYVHYFNEEELSTLAAETGFTVVETFYSDGESGRMGLYQNWEDRL
jgi:tRNA (uracil-5-)-methyltransferase TRM9